MFGRVFSRQGLEYHRDWMFGIRVVQDDAELRRFLLLKECLSIQGQAKVQEVLDRQAVEALGQKW